MVLYIPSDSLLHRLHPSTKIVGLAMLLILTVAFQSPWYQLAILSGVLLLAKTAGAFRNLRRILPLMITVLVFSAVSWSLFRRVGEPFWAFGPFTLSLESIRFGFAMGLRLEAMLVSGMIFVSCTKVEEFAYGLRTIGLPFAVSFALSLAFRLVPLFFTRIGTVVQAQQARGLDLKSGNVLQRARKYVPLLVPIFGVCDQGYRPALNGARIQGVRHAGQENGIPFLPLPLARFRRIGHAADLESRGLADAGSVSEPCNEKTAERDPMDRRFRAGVIGRTG